MRRRVLIGLAVTSAACARQPAPIESPGDPCAAAAFEPWDGPASSVADPAGPDDGVADGLIAVYQRFLRRPDLPGQGCPYTPSCSAFARRAVTRYGVLGLVLAFDRLFVREHPLAGRNYQTTCERRHVKWHDPVP